MTNNALAVCKSRQVLASLGKWVGGGAATGNPEIQATGSWARQSRYLGLGTWA